PAATPPRFTLAGSFSRMATPRKSKTADTPAKGAKPAKPAKAAKPAKPAKVAKAAKAAKSAAPTATGQVKPAPKKRAARPRAAAADDAEAGTGGALVVVESPTKAKSIGKYLGRGYDVRATIGHIRDLPTRKLGVDVENGFQPEYVTIKGKTQTLADLK